MSDKEPHLAGVSDPVRQHAAAWFARLRSGDVNERERSDFQSWLVSSENNRAAYERMEVLWSKLGAYGERFDIDSALRSADTHSSRRAVAGNSHGRLRQARFWASAAAVVLIAIAISWVTWRNSKSVETLTYSTAIGEQRSLALSDGSRLTLDTDTRLSVAFSTDVRQVTLARGRAFFDVAKDSHRAFLVSVNDSVIRAVGTRFDVEEHDDDVNVNLVEGRVVVSWNASGAISGVKEKTMEAGQHLLMGKAYPEPVLKPSNAGATAWLSGKLVFDDTPLPLAVTQFNRYSMDKISIGDAATARLHVTGVFRSVDSHSFVDALHTTYAVTITRGRANEWVLSTSDHL